MEKTMSKQKKQTILAAAMILLLSLPSMAQRATTAPRAERNITVYSSDGSWMGVGAGEVTSENAAKLKLKEERGVEIVTVSQDSPAEKAGLKEHDVVLDFNGARVESVEQFRRMIRETPAGRTVKLLISRDGAAQTVSVKLGERPSPRYFGNDGEPFVFAMPAMPPMPPIPAMPRTPRAPFALLGNTPRLGIEGDAVGKQLGEFFGVPNNEGVLVRAVTSGSAAEKAGIKAGDVIVKIDGHSIKDLEDVRDAMSNHSDKGTFAVILIRNKKEMTITVKLDRPEAPGERV